MTATAQPVAKRRQVALDAMADAALAEEAAAETARRAAAKAKAEAKARRKEALRRAKVAADAWIAAAAEVETGADRLVAGLRMMAEAGADLVRFPGAAACANRTAGLARAGDYLSRRLFEVARADNLGRLRLRAGGNSRTRNFAESERKVFDRIFAPPEQEDGKFTNGEDHGPD